MKKAIALASLLVCVVALSVTARAGDAKPAAKTTAKPETVVFDAESAFAYLKSLDGTWVRKDNGHEHGSTATQSTFRVSGAGSSVIETIHPGEPTEMVTVYHMDGYDLLLTHYCALHNAPVMKFKKTNQRGQIKFVFQGGTNFNPKVDMHVHEGAFKVENDNAIRATFVVFNNGKAENAVSSTLSRKLSK